MNEALEQLVATELDSLGFDLVELRRGGSRARPTLQVRIDRRDGQPVTIGDCAVASRAMEARLDAARTVGEHYVLEVSSPGVERLVTRASDWRRFVGQRVNVRSATLGGQQEVEIVGVQGEAGAEVVTVRMKDGDEQDIPLAEVREARLAFHW